MERDSTKSPLPHGEGIKGRGKDNNGMRVHMQ